MYVDQCPYFALSSPGFPHLSLLSPYIPRHYPYTKLQTHRIASGPFGFPLFTPACKSYSCSIKICHPGCIQSNKDYKVQLDTVSCICSPLSQWHSLKPPKYWEECTIFSESTPDYSSKKKGLIFSVCNKSLFWYPAIFLFFFFWPASKQHSPYRIEL